MRTDLLLRAGSSPDFLREAIMDLEEIAKLVKNLKLSQAKDATHVVLSMPWLTWDGRIEFTRRSLVQNYTALYVEFVH